MPNSSRSLRRAVPLLAALLGGCAHFAPLPLATAPPLVSSVGTLAGATSPVVPLSVEQVVELALADNPDLKAVRLRRAIASGQTEQAGILPNPTLSGAFLPLISGVGTVPAWSVGLSQNVKAIVTYRSRRRGALDSRRQVDADVVWQEWQVAGQARRLATDLILIDGSRPSYAAAYALLLERNAKLEQALAARKVTLTLVAPDRLGLQAARTALAALDQRRLATLHQLDALLGLRPGSAVPLAASADLPPFDPDAVRADLGTLPDRRPDLLALRLGYAAADENVRQAILSQFPDLILGGQASSDSSQVINAGPNISVGLPIFDRNQGNVAIANATRAQLNAAYAARLAAASGEVGALLQQYEQLATQLADARRDLPAARLSARRAEAAFGQSNLDERGFVDLVSNRFTKEQEIMTLELALADRRIAIQTLIGAGLPTADLPPEHAQGAGR